MLVVREARSYADGDYSGLLLSSAKITVKIFYIQPIRRLIGQAIHQGDPIGIAQDIGKKYDGITPHIHLEIVGMEPETLLNMA